MTDWKSHFVKVEGSRTHYLEAGEGRPVVLLHAGEYGAAAEFSWEHTIPALAKHYRVIAPDWLGFGHTDKIHDFVSGALRRLDHMASFIDAMDVGKAAYVGNSMGGQLLSRVLASEDPLWEAEAAVIVSAGGLAPENEHRQTLLNYDCSRESMRAVLKVLFRDPAIYDDEEYLDRRHEMSILPGAWECTAAARFRSPIAPKRKDFGVPDPTPLEQIRCPTLLMGGSADVLKEPGYIDELVARVPNGKSIVYEGCGHAPNVEIPDRFNADVLEFLAEHYPAPPSQGAPS